MDQAIWKERAVLTLSRQQPNGDELPVERLSEGPLKDIAVLVALMERHDNLHIDLPDRHASPFGFPPASIPMLLDAHRTKFT